MSNTWYDTLQGTGVDMIGGHTSDSGATYANLYGQTLVQMALTANHPYSATTGSRAFAVAGAALGLNDPVSMSVTLSGAMTSSSASADLLYRCQSSGACYGWRLNAHDNRIAWIYIDSTGTTNFGAEYVPGSVYASGTYVLTAAPWNFVHAAYLQRVSDGYYLNGLTGLFQAAPAPAVWQAHLLSDGSFLPAGSPGLALNFASGDTNAPAISLIQGGPAILTPPDLGCDLATDRFARLNVLSAGGGTAPIAYALERQPGSGGSWTTLGAIAPDAPYLDSTVSASTSYNYRAVATDAASVQATSGTVSVTTTAAQTPATYTPTTPAVPYTEVLTGTVWDDTTGTRTYANSPYVWWDDLYQLYFCVGQKQDVGGTGVLQFYGYWSTDLMNWNPAPSNPLVDGTSPINGVQYQGIHRCSAVQHPTDGHYYLTATGLVANGTAWQLLVFKSPYPLGPYSYYSGPFVPNSYSPEESDILTDYDGSLWGFTSNFARTVASVICQLKGDLTAYTGANNGSLLIREGIAPFRRDRTVWCGHSKETGWWPNNNDAMAMGTPAAQTLASGASAAALWPNTGLFTSAAQQIATPAGAGPSVYPYGYGGELGTDPAGDSAQAYIDGTATGIDPLASYTSQSCKVLRTRTGQRIWIGDRHDYSGVSTGGTLASTYTWWPISFDIDNRPQVPFVSSFAPAAQPALPGASAYYIQSGSPGLAPALIGATR